MTELTEYEEEINEEVDYVHDNLRLRNIMRMVGKNHKVLDVGCYKGIIGEMLIKNGNEVFGIDMFKKGLEEAAKKGLKVWLAASAMSRARRMAKRDKMSVTQCLNVLSIRDSENYKLYKRIYGIEFGKDLKPFDLVVDTDSIDESRVAEIVLHYVKNRTD